MRPNQQFNNMLNYNQFYITGALFESLHPDGDTIAMFKQNLGTASDLLTVATVIGSGVADILLVGGGGDGNAKSGADGGGGGGGGAVVFRNKFKLSSGTYSLQVGGRTPGYNRTGSTNRTTGFGLTANGAKNTQNANLSYGNTGGVLGTTGPNSGFLHTGYVAPYYFAYGSAGQGGEGYNLDGTNYDNNYFTSDISGSSQIYGYAGGGGVYASTASVTDPNLGSWYPSGGRNGGYWNKTLSASPYPGQAGSSYAGDSNILSWNGAGGGGGASGNAANSTYGSGSRGIIIIKYKKVLLTYLPLTGGTTNTYNSGTFSYKSHKFTSNGTLSVPDLKDFPKKIEYLIIGGGGGGGYPHGGGAGGVLIGTAYLLPGSYSITIGTGGGGSSSGTNGGNSTAFSLIAYGGGGGGYVDSPYGGVKGLTGGSGGGSGVVYGAAAGVSGQGSAGGTGVWGSFYAGGGGGGSSGVGSNNSGNNGGNGGIGLTNSYETGVNKLYAGGGGGGGNGTSYTGGSNSYGGGHGLGTGYPYATVGTPNTGGGGGGGNNSINGATGGSGIVIIRYEI